MGNQFSHSTEMSIQRKKCKMNPNLSPTQVQTPLSLSIMEPSREAFSHADAMGPASKCSPQSPKNAVSMNANVVDLNSSDAKKISGKRAGNFIDSFYKED